MSRFTDKVCVVTGGANGIGAAVAARFAAEGAVVVVADIDPTADAHLDVASEADWATLAARHPRIDVLVNNAGITGLGDGTGGQSPAALDLGGWRRVQAVNADGVFLGCRYALGAMRGTGGVIVNMASHAATIGVPDAIAYAASKAAVCSLTKSVALYAAREKLGIRCNAVLPGAVLTGMWEPMLGDGPERDANMAACVAETPLARFADPEDVAALVAFLASAESCYMTGALVPIDGGLAAA